MPRQMKYSGIEWIGEIPETWSVDRNKKCFVCSKAIVGTDSKKTQLLSLTTKGVKQKNEADTSGKVPESYDTYQLVDVNDLIMCLFDLDCSAVFSGLSTYAGMVSPAYKILKCRENMTPLFADYWFKFVFEGRKFKHYAKSLRYTLNFDEFATLPILIPSLEEQNCIVQFLDERCAHIDSVLEQTRSSIEEYKKLKQSVISNAVTSGIRGDRSVRDSGDKWIGVIPEGWRITQLRHCASVKSGITLGKTYSGETELKEMPYLRVANVQDGYVDISDMAVLAVTDDEIEKYRLHAGDVLMTEGGDRDKFGRGCVWDARIDPCLHQNHIFAVKTNESLLNPYFLEYVTASKIGRTYFDITAIKTTNLACTSSSKVMAFVIPLPSLEEQAEIVAYLKEKCGAIDNLISKKELVISELTNYKKSMIYEYVTGKKEVPQS